MAEQKDQTIVEIDLGNPREPLRISKSPYRGKMWVSVRRWFEKNGEWFPSREGFSMPVDEWDSFVMAVNEADEGVNA